MRFCQLAVLGNAALRVWNRLLCSPSIDVPSGAKLRVRWVGFHPGQSDDRPDLPGFQLLHDRPF